MEQHPLTERPADDGAGEVKSAAGIVWDLGILFSSVDDPQIDANLKSVSDRVEMFEKKYRGIFQIEGGPSAQHLLKALREAEAIQEQIVAVDAYASLTYAADTTQESNRKLVQRVEEALTAVRNRLLFFDLEWLAVSDADAERLTADPALQVYAHYLRSARRFKPHTLSEPEEKVINDKDQTGISAWQKLFTEVSSSLRYPVEQDGQLSQLNQGQVLSLLRHPDRQLRKRAFDSLYATLRGQGQVLSFIYDTRFHDHLVNDRLRHYPDPMSARHLANEVNGAAVSAMMGVVERNYPLAQRYFKMKARLLGLTKLELFDQYAPLFELKETFSYTEAQATILKALQRFSPDFQAIAQRFFDERWIDADPRTGKRGGAFCSGVAPAVHPFILCSYNDDMRDVMTVAHELGHGIHFYLSGKQTLFNYYMSLPVAETASVFSEMLVFDDLLAGMSDPHQRLALICGKLEDSFATVFRQTVLTRFEEGVYRARAQGRLSVEQIKEVWLAANAPYYGDSMNLTAGYEWGWSYIPHFIHTPFYCYAYSFGELLVLALYGKYRREGHAFVPQYKALLESGGSLSPSDQLAAIGININDTAFWQVGFDELERLMNEAERLAAQQAQEGRAGHVTPTVK
jgi:oligoendopeptidase F